MTIPDDLTQLKDNSHIQNCEMKITNSNITDYGTNVTKLSHTYTLKNMREILRK